MNRLRSTLLGVLLVPAVAIAAAPAVPAQTPANDNLADAVLLLDVPLVGDTTGATDETDELTASCGGSESSPGVWYVLPVADEDGTAVVDTDGSTSIDTVLSVWIGAGHPLLQVGCNDDVAGDLWSRVVVEVAAATTYYVKVSGRDGEEGEFVVNSTVAVPPANDYLANAIEITTPTSFHDERNTLAATHEIDEAMSSCGLTYLSGDEELGVWYTLTADEDTPVRLTTEGSAFDTVLSVWVDGPAHPLTEIACNDDDGDNLWSTISFTAQAGVPYSIKAAGGPRQGGHLVIGTTQWPVYLPFTDTP